MRKLRKVKPLSFLAAVAILATLAPGFSVPAFAQATSGQIKGVVTDQTGAVIGGATVSAKNQATGVTTPAFKSTSEGLYVIPNLTPGQYTLTIESPNFKRSVYTDVDVRLGQDTVIDVALQPGVISETVNIVAGSEEIVQRDSSQVSSSFEARKVADLPSNVAGAGIDTLALLAPGVTPGFGNVNNNGTTLSVNGNRARSNNFTIDGQDNNDLSIGGPNYFVSNQDIVADFQVVTNNFSAQYGRNQGAIVNIVTKPGTNEFHGTGFWYHRDRKLFETQTNFERRGRDDARPESLEAPPLLYNVYGGTLGGPIIRDKAFFFGSYQGIKSRESFIARSGALAILPSEFGRLKAAFPGNPIVDVITNFSAFAITDFGNVRPRTDLSDPFDTIILGGIPFAAAFPEREFKVAATTPVSDQYEFTGRGDVKLGSRDDLWARYLFQDGVTKDALGGSAGFTGDVPFRSQNLGATWSRQVASNAVNEFRFAYSRLFVLFGGGCEGKIGCIPDPKDLGTAFTNISFGSVRGVATGQSMQTIGPATNLPQGREVEAFQFADNYSWTIGKHQLMFGADIRRLRNQVPFLPNLNGQFNVSTAARLVANSPLRVTLAAGEDTIKYYETDQFYFFQTDWKIRDNMTLNLGVRYEYIGQPINTLHELTLERESNPATAVWRQNIPLEGRIVNKLPADKNNWAPRFGFAYTPRFWKGLFGDGDTVIRGGYSLAYDPPFYNIMLNISTAAPTVFNNITSNPATSPIFPLPSSTPTGDVVRAFAESRGLIAVNTFDPAFQTRTIVDPSFYNPYAQQWSLGISRQVNRSNVFEVRYLGTRGVGLFMSQNVNPLISNIRNGFTISGINFPGFPELLPAGLTPLSCTDNPATPDNEGACNGRITRNARVLARTNSATSIYHSLQTRYNGRLANQLTFGASYTFSKALDNASEIFAFQENAVNQHPFNVTSESRSFSGFDRRNAFSANGLWDIPAFKDQKGVLGKVLGGWQINGTWVIADGLRYTPVQIFNTLFGFPTYADPLFGDTLRPFYGNPNADPTKVGISQIDAALIFGTPITDLNGLLSFNELNANSQVVPVTKDQVKYIFNGPGAARIFGSPFGDVPRNSEVGPLLNQVNAGFFKNTRLNERLTIQFRTEVFNLFNHPNPGYGQAAGGAIPDNLIEDAGTFFNRRDEIEFGRRILQFGLKFIF